MTDFLVECPSCGKAANILETSEEEGSKALLTCLACGKAQNTVSPMRSYGEANDPYFSFPLWLQTTCCGEVLWAYNRRHLAYLREFVDSKLRDVGSPGDRQLGNNLPKWMLLAKNRTAVIKAIAKLERK